MKFELNKKDLSYNWFSGTGAGGQHRNKHQNCLRLKHIPSGLTVTGQTQRDRIGNEKEAITKLTKLVKAFYYPEVQKERFRAKEEIRVYREVDDRVKDHASGKTFSYKSVIIDADAKEVDRMIETRKLVMQE